MALKKPSELFDTLNKPKIKIDETSSDTPEEVSLNLFENFQKFSKKIEYFQENDEKIENILLDINSLRDELDKSLKQEDLDKAMMSQLLVVESAIKGIHKKLSGINKKDLEEVRSDILQLNNLVSEFVEDTLPKYKRLFLDTEIRIDNKYENFETSLNEILENSIENVTEFVEEKYEELKNSINNEFNSLESSFNELSETEIPKYKRFIVETEKKVEDKIKDFNEKLESVNTIVLEKINSVEGDKEHLLEKVNTKIKEITQFIYEQNKFKKRVVDLEIEVLKNEKKLNDVENYLLENHEELITLREEVFAEISNIPIGDVEKNVNEIKRKINYIEEIYKNIDPDKLVSETIQESLLAEPSSTANKDPLTPLDQKYVTFDKLQEHYRLFINRIQQQLSSLGGGGETRLKYLDDIVGIATNPSAYDGKFLKYNDSTKSFVFDDVPEQSLTISEQNIIYVAKDGNDSNAGTLSRPKLTIKSAVGIAITETVIRVAPGTYFEDNPITLPDNVTVMGHSIRETTVIPLNDDEDLFYVGNGNYVAEMSFRGSMPGKAVFAFDPINERYIDQSPYIQNCTNFIPDSVGMRIDGKEAIGPLKSMVLDSYTQYNQGGIGVSITNEGYAQLVSLFTICDDIAVYCGSGAACDLTNSNSSFGNYGLVADGVSPKKFVGIVTVASAENADTFVIDLSVPTLNVVNADYNNETGRIEITVDQPHKFNVGMGVSIVGLAFTCPFEGGSRLYPSGEKGYVFNVETVAPGRYLDAANLIVANTQEIVDKSLAAVAIAHSDFYFPGDTQTTIRSRYYDAYRLIQRNKEVIVDAAWSATSLSYPQFNYTETTCKRDIGFFIDAVSTDVFTGGNSYARDFVLQYFNGTNPIGIATTEREPSVYAFENARDLMKQAITNTLVGAAYSDLTLTVDPLTGSNVDPLSCADVRSNIDNLVGIVTVSIGAGNTSSLPANPNKGYFNLSVGIGNTVSPGGLKCARDISYIVNATVEDLRGYTNANIIDATKKYFNYDGTLNYLIGEEQESITAFNATRDYMKLALNNQLNVKDLTVLAGISSIGGGGPIIPILPSGSPNACSDVRYTIDTNIEILTTAINSASLSSVPTTVSLASTEFSLDVGIATQPHYYAGGGIAKLNVIRPFDGQAAYFNELFYTVKTLNIVSGGSGYTDLPTITIDPPDTPWGVQAQAVPTIENGTLTSVEMLSNGRGYRVPPKVTISSGINTAVATAELVPEYYTVQKSTEIVNGVCIVTFNENVPFVVGVGTEVAFFKQSRVLATGHSFEFIGAGVDIATALPFTGGVPIEDNETDSRNGGLVVYSSTNQSGNFKIGDGVKINQNTGSITGKFYSKSLFSTMTPFILSLGGF